MSTSGYLDPLVKYASRPAGAAAKNESGLWEGRGAREIVVTHEGFAAQRHRILLDAAKPL